MSWPPDNNVHEAQHAIPLDNSTRFTRIEHVLIRESLLLKKCVDYLDK